MKIAGFPFSAAFSVVLLIGVLAWLFLAGREQPEPMQPLSPPLVMQSDVLQPILPLVPIEGLDPGRIALGERLFHDPRLSADLTVSCASCHNLTAGGVDGQRFSVGIGGARGGINAPTVLNAAYGIAQFWDGRAATLEEQAAGPIQNPIEMGATWSQVLTRLELDPEMLAGFRRLYRDGLTENNVLDAIATFERSLITVDSRFDRYLRGDRDALMRQEIDGYRRFREFGCTSCHQGMLLGGNMYQKFGVLGDYFAGRTVTDNDLGRYNVTRRDEDRHVFKVPSLRNVAQTAPYFHDGSAATLEQAVLVMARYQLGRDLSAADNEAIVAFLRTLSGELPASRP
ncbi:MAG TPA: cytochrome-c peroxidase [Azonexus sp.]